MGDENEWPIFLLKTDKLYILSFFFDAGPHSILSSSDFNGLEQRLA